MDSDTRGIGELAVSKPAWTAAVSLLLDEYFVQREAGDLRALSAALQATSEKEIPFHLLPHRALERFDIMGTLGSVEASGFVVDPLDGDWQPATASRSRYRVPSQVHLVFSGESGSQPQRLIQAPRSEP